MNQNIALTSENVFSLFTYIHYFTRIISFHPFSNLFLSMLGKPDGWLACAAGYQPINEYPVAKNKLRIKYIQKAPKF